MGDFENRMQLKSISAPLMAIAVAKNSLIEQIFTIADREVDGTPHCKDRHLMFLLVLPNII